MSSALSASTLSAGPRSSYEYTSAGQRVEVFGSLFLASDSHIPKHPLSAPNPKIVNETPRIEPLTPPVGYHFCDIESCIQSLPFLRILAQYYITLV